MLDENLFFFNANSLKNEKNQRVYKIIFQKNTTVLVADTMMTKKNFNGYNKVQRNMTKEFLLNLIMDLRQQEERQFAYQSLIKENLCL